MPVPCRTRLLLRRQLPTPEYTGTLISLFRQLHISIADTVPGPTESHTTVALDLPLLPRGVPSSKIMQLERSSRGVRSRSGDSFQCAKLPNPLRPMIYGTLNNAPTPNERGGPFQFDPFLSDEGAYIAERQPPWGRCSKGHMPTHRQPDCPNLPNLLKWL